MKIVYAVAVLGLLACPEAFAQAEKKQQAQAAPKQQSAKTQQQAPQAKKSWFEATLKSMKTRVADKFHSSGVSAGAVAAVRGDQMGEDAEKPYWKGGMTEKASKKLEAEKDQFAAALELAIAGKNDEAYAALQKFLADNPSSVLVPDVKEALSRLNQPAQPAAVETSTATAPAAPAAEAPAAQ